MKQCPFCRTTYTDDMLKFCLQDGTPLVSPANPETEIPTVAFTDSETLVSPRRVEPLNVPIVNTPTHNWEPNQQTQTADLLPEPKKSNTFLIVALTALVTLILFSGAIGTWFYLKKGRTDIVQNTNNKPAVNQNAAPKNTANTEVSPTATATATATPIKTPSPATATPTVTPTNIDPEQVSREVGEKINAWKSAAESKNLNAYMNNYADTVDFYNSRNAGLEVVRKDKQKAFNKYGSIEINISNLRVTPDSSGETSTAVFDKEWRFEGEESYSAGKVQTQLKLRKFGGRWLITGEKDLRIYYTE